MGSIYEDVYGHICRVCLGHSAQKMIPLLDTKSDAGQDVFTCYGKAVLTFADISICDNEDLPVHICQKCLIRLKQAIHFKFLCERSDRHIRQLVKNNCTLTQKDLKENIVQYSMFVHHFPLIPKKTTDKSNSTYTKKREETIYADNGEEEFKDSDSITYPDDICNDDSYSDKEYETQNEDILLERIEQVLGYSSKRPHENAWHGNATKRTKSKEYKVTEEETIDHMDEDVKVKMKRLGVQFLKDKFLSKKEDGKPSSLTCDVCQKTFASYRTLKHHSQRHYGFRFICEHCAKGFPCRAELQQHQVVHHGIGRMFQCQQCSFKAPRRFDVTEHERVHTGERPYACERCGLTFRRKGVWRKHLVHHAEKRFQCTQCSRRFFHRGDLKEHVNNVHQRRYLYRCHLCGATYAKPASVRKHLSDQHGVPRPAQGRISRVNVDGEPSV